MLGMESLNLYSSCYLPLQACKCSLNGSSNFRLYFLRCLDNLNFVKAPLGTDCDSAASKEEQLALHSYFYQLAESAYQLLIPCLSVSSPSALSLPC